MLKSIKLRWSNERGSAMMVVFFCVILLALLVPMLLQVFGTSNVQQVRLTKERNAIELAIGNMESYMAFLKGYTYTTSDQLRIDVKAYTEDIASGKVTNSKGQQTTLSLVMTWPDVGDRYTILSKATTEQVVKSITYTFLKEPVVMGPIVEEDKHRGCATGTFILGGNYSNSQNTPSTIPASATDGQKPNDSVPVIQHYPIKAPIEQFLAKKATLVNGISRPVANTRLHAAQFERVNDYLSGAHTVISLDSSTYTFTNSKQIGQADQQATLLLPAIILDNSTLEVYGDVYAKSIIARNGGRLIVHGNIIVDSTNLTIESNHPITATNLYVKGAIQIKNTQEFVIKDDIIANQMTVDDTVSVKAKRVMIINELTMKNYYSTTGTVDIIAGSFLMNADSTINTSGDVLVARDFTVSNSFTANVGGNFAIGGNFSVHSSAFVVDVPEKGEGSSSLIIEGGECKRDPGAVPDPDTPSIWEPTPST